jgi:hypothetical protein
MPSRSLGKLANSTPLLLASCMASLAYAGAQSPTQPSSASIPETPAGGLDPSKLPDVEGIHLGMTPDQAMPKFKALATARALEVANGRYDTVSNAQWPVYVVAYTATGNTNTESLAGTFSSPPNKQALVKLERQTTFGVGKQPTAETVKAALFEKYGPNATQVGPNMWVWTFNETGGPMTSPPPARQLSNSCDPLLAPRSNIKAYIGSPVAMDQQDLKQWMNMHCNTYGVFVKASFGGSSLQIVMDDTAEDMRDALAGQHFIDQSNAEKVQHLQKDTQKNVPTL